MSSAKISPPAPARRPAGSAGRFRNGHEIPGDLRMRDRDRSAAEDLLAEQRHHAAAESSTLPNRTVMKRVLLSRASVWNSSSATRLLAPSRGRVHRLVGGNQHEALDPCRIEPSASVCVASTLLRNARATAPAAAARVVRRGVEHGCAKPSPSRVRTPQHRRNRRAQSGSTRSGNSARSSCSMR